MKANCNMEFPILVDMMDNSVSLKYAAFPERLYVVLDGIVVYTGGSGPLSYDLSGLREWIKSFVAKCN